MIIMPLLCFLTVRKIKKSTYANPIADRQNHRGNDSKLTSTPWYRFYDLHLRIHRCTSNSAAFRAENSFVNVAEPKIGQKKPLAIDWGKRAQTIGVWLAQVGDDAKL